MVGFKGGHGVSKSLARVSNGGASRRCAIVLIVLMEMQLTRGEKRDQL